MIVLFPHLRDLLPHLGAAEGTELGSLPTARRLAECRASLQRSRVAAEEVDANILPVGARPTVSLDWSDFESSRDRLQREFSTLTHADDFCRMYSEAPTEAAKARILSLSTPGAQAHWSAIPAFYHFSLPSGPATVALNLQLGLPQPSLRGVRTCVCGATIDPLGYHYLVCARRGWVITQHDGVRDTVAAMLKTVYDPGSVKVEPRHHHEYSPHKRPIHFV
eukprot:CAMPEP_0197865052 /NCGR_PEP_ID=MMETSP1438-20131217/43442_1 /TAXON_ID=1461541 /ORGANISM="Pterosperma sp., Strain CCMP1384" /LENGTH=220 /DNA_ID=CAMNT_0043483459 /DNA_START=23 /DNA_END=685 /DNA_ORIENTATION=-